MPAYVCVAVCVYMLTCACVSSDDDDDKKRNNASTVGFWRDKRDVRQSTGGRRQRFTFCIREHLPRPVARINAYVEPDLWWDFSFLFFSYCLYLFIPFSFVCLSCILCKRTSLLNYYVTPFPPLSLSLSLSPPLSHCFVRLLYGFPFLSPQSDASPMCVCMCVEARVFLRDPSVRCEVSKTRTGTKKNQEYDSRSRLLPKL
uniref:Secreted peptide n=1 Tax=Anopheles braziliensis TaxID=58242 RepID=A0A2M3ZLS0_9DIPT